MGNDIGLLILRIWAGGLICFSHGLPKLLKFSQMAAAFPDPLGLGPTASLVLTIFAEFVCGLGVLLGISTRFVAIPLVITMLVATFVVHSADPWGKKEFAFLYAGCFLTLCFTGAGAFSLDPILKKLKERKR